MPREAERGRERLIENVRDNEALRETERNRERERLREIERN